MWFYVSTPRTQCACDHTSESVNLQLDDRALPWFPLHFTEISVEIRETFSFAFPDQILMATHMYCLHLYGNRLWNLSSDQTGHFCRTWNTSVKLAHNVPKGTKTCLMDNFLADDFIPVMQEILT